nr:Wadjet anti-phage system protein JetD domain-containing protein [Moritella viscosa]SHO15520.1 Putative uncharacterized protein [Moritella viscosa]
MKNIIEKIIECKPIKKKHLEQIEKYCLLNNFNINDFLLVEQIQNHTFITITDRKIFDQVFNIYLDENENERVQSALEGDSHQVRCTKGIIVYKKSINSAPKVLITPTDKMQRRKIIIIENLETFLDDDFLTSLKITNIEEYSIVYGQGTGILNKKYDTMFSELDEIICLFDWDYYGLSMFKSLYEKHKNCKWYTEEYFYEYLNKVVKTGRNSLSRKDTSDLKQMVNDQTIKPIIAMIKAGKKIEQEVFQAGRI